MSEIEHKKRKIIGLVAILVVMVLSIYIYTNSNRLISKAIMLSFDSNVISDVYDLNFDHLNVNFATGEIKIRNVVIAPKKTPLQLYPYINSSFVLKTKSIVLKKVGIYFLLKHNRLQVSKIEIEKPEIEMQLKGKYPIFFPFKEGEKTDDKENKLLKNSLDSYFLKEFVLREASLTMEDGNDGKSYRIGALNIFISDIQLNQQAGVDSLTFRKGDLVLRDFVIRSEKGGFQSMKSKNYELNIDSFAIQQHPDTADYQVANLMTKIQDWELVTSDSIYVIGAKSVELSRRDKTLNIAEFIMKPAVSQDAFNQLHKYQRELYSITVKKVNLLNISFDSLKLYQTLLIGQVKLDSADVLIYRDKTIPDDMKRFPEFPAQQFISIKFPMTINELELSESKLEYQEKKKDGYLGRVKINNLHLIAHHISNQTSDSGLSVKLDGNLENKVPFNLALMFSYKIPEFSFSGRLKPFEFADLKGVTGSFGSLDIKKGVVDEIAFSGNGYKSSARGEMKFLYHDLDLTMDLKKLSKLENSLISFAANTYLNSSNPAAPGKAAREVKFDVERDRHKGFMNLVIKSVVSGLQQTMLPSKENRRSNRDSKKALKREQKEKNQASPR